MKTLLFLATQKGYEVLSALIDNGYSGDIGAVISFHEVNVEKDWHDDIASLCKSVKISFFDWRKAKSNLCELIKEYDITYAIAISWKYMISNEVCDGLKVPLIVFHDSLLPKYRGFAPLPTAVICGENEVGVTALFAVDEVDAGPVIMQESIEIDNSMYIQEIIDCISKLYVGMTIKLFKMFRSGENIPSVPQNKDEATYSIWRSPEDCRIDWTQNATGIFNMIRAVSHPYTGAYTFLGDKKVFIEKSVVVDDIPFAIRQPGKIWKIEDNQPTVICGDGMLRICRAIDSDGNLAIFNHVRVRFV